LDSTKWSEVRDGHFAVYRAVGQRCDRNEQRDYAAFANLGVQILVSVSGKVSIWNPVVGTAAVIVAVLILVALALITVNLILVNCETYIMMAGGIILLAFAVGGALRATVQKGQSLSRGN